MSDLAAGLYEICAACGGECDGCRTCWDKGLVKHECDPTPDDPPTQDENDHA